MLDNEANEKLQCKLGGVGRSMVTASIRTVAINLWLVSFWPGILFGYKLRFGIYRARE